MRREIKSTLACIDKNKLALFAGKKQGFKVTN